MLVGQPDADRTAAMNDSNAQDAMTGEPAPFAAAPRDGLASQLQQLEDFVARAKSDGDELPPAALEMIARLREIMQALDGLTSTLGGAAPAIAAGPPPELP